MAVTLKTRTLTGGKLSYYLDISYNGKRWREFLKIITSKSNSKETNKELEALAKIIQSRRQIELTVGAYDNIDELKQRTKKQNKCFTTYFEKLNESYSKKDTRKMNATLIKFKEFFGYIDAKALNHQKCQDFYDFLSSHQSINSNQTVNSYFGIFRKIIHQAERDGLLSSDPTKLVKKERIYDTINKQVLTVDEINILHNTTCNNNEVKRAFLFALNTGLGLAELKLLEWKHITNGKITQFKRAKTGTPLDIPLNHNARQYLGTRNNLMPNIFKPPTTNGCNKSIKKWIKDAGIEKHITFYCARHSFACNALIYGGSQKAVSNLLGHTNTKTTDKYLNYVDALSESAVNGIPTILDKNKSDIA